MKPARPRFARAHGGMLVAAVLLALVAACDTPLPTSADIDNMDVASAEAWAIRVKLLESVKDSVVYTIDGVHASADQARAIDPAQIARIIVEQRALPQDSGSAGQYDEIEITTRNGYAATDNGRRATTPSRNAGPDTRVRSNAADTAYTALFVIDGVPTDAAALKKLAPTFIKSIEVIKGPTAVTLYSDPRAANGVVKITTFSGSSSK